MNHTKNLGIDIYKSKSCVLEFLQKKLHKSRIEKLFYFQIQDWENNQKQIIEKIQNTFSKKIIVRSSAIGEDSVYDSGAGAYLSIQNVNPTSKKQVTNSITSVINSYEEKQNFNLKNEVLIQTQSTDIMTSGVIFTRTPETGSPYYVINFDKGTSTVGVTAGSIGNVLKIFRKSDYKIIPSPWNNLLDSILLYYLPN